MTNRNIISADDVKRAMYDQIWRHFIEINRIIGRQALPNKKKVPPIKTQIRIMSEENSKQKKKITELNKTIKTLKADNEKLKAQIPIMIDPNEAKSKRDVVRRFETMDIV